MFKHPYWTSPAEMHRKGREEEWAALVAWLDRPRREIRGRRILLDLSTS